LIDESALHEFSLAAFEFQLIKRPHMEARIRLPEGQGVGSLTHIELLEKYWQSNHIETDEIEALKRLAEGLVQDYGQV
jgi:hypothetical protein